MLLKYFDASNRQVCSVGCHQLKLPLSEPLIIADYFDLIDFLQILRYGFQEVIYQGGLEEEFINYLEAYNLEIGHEGDNK